MGHGQSSPAASLRETTDVDPGSSVLTIPPRGNKIDVVTTTLEQAPRTAVLHVGGLHYATEKGVVEAVLGRRPGVLEVEANPVAQTASVSFDPAVTSVAELRGWVEECGYHCA